MVYDESSPWPDSKSLLYLAEARDWTPQILTYDQLAEEAVNFTYGRSLKYPQSYPFTDGFSVKAIIRDAPNNCVRLSFQEVITMGQNVEKNILAMSRLSDGRILGYLFVRNINYSPVRT